MTVFTDQIGNNTYRGRAADYDQVDFDAPLSEYSIFTNANGSVTASHPTLGTDTLFDINGIWSIADSAWYSIEDAIALTADAPIVVDLAPIPAPVPSPGPTSPDANDFVLDDFGVLRGTDANDLLLDTANIHSLYGGQGDDTLIGTANEYSQAEYDGAASEYTFTQNNDGTVTVDHPVWGTDTLDNIDGFWFQGEQEWYALEDLVSATVPVPAPTPTPAPTPGPTSPDANDFVLDDFGVLRGTDANDLLLDTSAIHSLYGGQGDDTLIGTANEYSQAEYDGAASEYTFTQNNDGTVTVDHPVWGTDTLDNIDGFWFQGEQEWYALEDLVDNSVVPNNPPQDDPAPTPEPTPEPDAPDTGTTIDGVITGSNDVNDFLNGDGGANTFFAGRGTDVINGGAGNDTLIVDGDIIEWTFTTNNDGSVTMTHPTWGENTLNGIEQITSLRGGETVSLGDAIAATAGLPDFRLDNDNVINGTNGNDVLEGGAGIQGFYGGTGDDVFLGTGDFVQVNYDGARSEYNISENGDGSITVDHPIWGTDTLSDIDGLVFTGVEPGVGGAVSAPFEFISTDDLFA